MPLLFDCTGNTLPPICGFVHSGFVSGCYLMSELAISRAIGDADFKNKTGRFKQAAEAFKRGGGTLVVSTPEIVPISIDLGTFSFRLWIGACYFFLPNCHELVVLAVCIYSSHLCNIVECICRYRYFLPILISAHDRFAVLACDGLYDKMENKEIVEFVSERLNKTDTSLDQISKVHVSFVCSSFKII